MRTNSYTHSFSIAAAVLLQLATVTLLVPAALGAALSGDTAQRAVAVSGVPVIDPLSAMVVTVNESADQPIHATDADGDPLTFSKAYGPTYMVVTTLDPGTGSATGNVNLSPGSADAGSTTASVSVTDGEHTNQSTFSIQVLLPGAAPVMDPLTNMTVAAGSAADQPLHATDANGDILEFYVGSGPVYVSASTVDLGNGEASGTLHVAPPPPTASAIVTVVVGVGDGERTDEESFVLTVTKTELPPVLAAPPNVNLRVGEVRDVALYAIDQNGDPLTFSKVSGPAYMTVTTLDPGQGSAVGNMHFTPGPSHVGTANATVSVTDGLFTDQKPVFITVTQNVAPSLSFVNNMTVPAGSTSSQYVYSTDSDADEVLITKVSGPTYMNVYSYYQYDGYTVGEIRLEPSLIQEGNATGTVQASDGILATQASFSIFVTPPNHAPVLTQPVDMSVTAGELAEQTVTATDADGNYNYIYKVSGPNYVTLNGYGNYGNSTATIRVTPGVGDVGTATATIAATDYYLTDTKSFMITVTSGVFPAPCPASSFYTYETSFGYGPIEVQTADLNGDDVLDLVVELPDEGRVKVALGIGDGTFGTPAPLIAGIYPVSGAIADFNQDDLLDLAIVNAGSNNVSVFLGNGTGEFGSKVDFATGGGPRSIVAADVNRDGKLDLLVANGGSGIGSVSILRGLGTGSFSAATSLPAGQYAWALAAPDLTGDGAPDLVVTNPGDADISVYLNNGFGTFGSRTDYAVGSDPLAVATGDVNGDGKADIVVSNANSQSLSLFLGNGNGMLGTRRNYATHFGPRQIAITDMNGDNFPDLSVVNFDSNDLSMLLGDGAGLFGPRTDIPMGYTPYGLATGDFNDDLRSDLVSANYYAGSLTVLLNSSCAPVRDHPPVVKAPKNVTGPEGAAIAFTVTASDPDGPALTGLSASFAGLPLGNNATFTPNAGFASGTFAWTPTYQDARATPYPVTFTATNILSGTALTKITVTNVNRAPIANAGGPYTAFMGIPLTFNGSASSDPDGDALTYLWLFGDGATGMGVAPAHAYAAVGVYGVALSVTDGALTSLSTTTATIVGIFQARAFTAGGNRSIRLSSGKPQWSLELEPIGRSYSNETVNIASIVMKSPGTGSIGQISAIASKTVVGSDKDANGVEEITISFSKDDLRLLFSNLHGTTSATVTVEGSLYTGGVFRASLDVGVIAGGGTLAASINPNPLNPSATLTYFTSKSGPVRIQMFDPQGRLVRAMHEPQVSPGYHDLAIDGRDGRGVPLASGVYYYRLEAIEGITTGRFTVLR